MVYVNAAWMWISAIAVSYDCAISSICILFFFPFSNKLYLKYCDICHEILKSKYSNGSVVTLVGSLGSHIDDHKMPQNQQSNKKMENQHEMTRNLNINRFIINILKRVSTVTIVVPPTISLQFIHC